MQKEDLKKLIITFGTCHSYLYAMQPLFRLFLIRGFENHRTIVRCKDFKRSPKRFSIFLASAERANGPNTFEINCWQSPICGYILKREFTDK